MRTVLLLGALAAAAPAPISAEMLVATRTIRGQTILGPGDVALAEGTMAGALTDPYDAIGQEARVNLYAGRPIMAGDLGAPAIIERNQIVTVFYRNGVVNIAADGRALERAGIGDPLRVMNLASRTTVTGFVASDGTVTVGASARP
ncbi:flagellar basal body P-ring formation chaperone FlgA [Rhodovulum steppense]|uniref:Flagella basal body P-ring formation protein FlgA n=1 Tax=Rhodovulum steppense TaxID=540251 RepID=A0A4R1Z0G5_9RHOB|nr:flagellar basal body P-ring formation chaperone FlgA [Rhodovulum steppense]TCM87060.1 flagella basal body P-ring formation protein FlgA [Rhodovulum steppense]